MARKTRSGNTQGLASASPEVTIIIDKVIYDLLQKGEITQVLTWKEFSEKPSVIAVTTAEQDEAILFHVKHMDTVGFGYLPKGYPEWFQARRGTTRFHVVPILAAEQPQSETGE